MRKSILLAFLFVLLFAGIGQAQIVSYGAKGGGVISRFYTEHMGTSYGKTMGAASEWPVPGFSLLVNANYYLNKKLYISGELGYLQQGSDMQIGDTEFIKYSQGYIHFPLMAKYVLSLSRMDLQFLKAGFFNNFLMHSTTTQEGIDYETQHSVNQPAEYYKTDISDTELLKGHGLGFTVGAGSEWLVMKRKAIVSAEIRYMLSMSKMNKGVPTRLTEETFPKYHAIMLTLGFMIYHKF